MNLTVVTTIAAPPADVWQVIEPIERHVDWMTDAESITFTSAARRGVGTRFDCLTKVGPFRTTDRMRVTEDRRAPRLHEVEVLATVGIHEICAVRAGNEERVAADRAERAHWRVHAAGNAGSSPREPGGHEFC